MDDTSVRDTSTSIEGASQRFSSSSSSVSPSFCDIPSVSSSCCSSSFSTSSSCCSSSFSTSSSVLAASHMLCCSSSAPSDVRSAVDSSVFSAASSSSNSSSSLSVLYSSSSGSSSVLPSSSASVGSSSGMSAPPSSSLQPDISLLKEEIIDMLRKVQDPDLHKDIVTLNFVQDIKIDYFQSRVQVDLLLTTPACPMKNFFIETCTSHIKKIKWVKNVSIVFVTSSDSSLRSRSQHHQENLKNVDSIVCVSSCKGGVGKSSIAVNLAFMLKRMGAKVGILDADIYGPSLHILLHMNNHCVYFGEEKDVEDEGKEDEEQMQKKKGEKEGKKTGEAERQKTQEHKRKDGAGRKANFGKIGMNIKQKKDQGKQNAALKRIEYEYEREEENEVDGETDLKEAKSEEKKEEQLWMIPLKYKGVKLMSYGFIKKQGEMGFSAIRGPLVSGIFIQMLLGTLWGKLDYLIIDMPPGTGDVHMSLANHVACDANIVVSTPHTLSIVDVEKGIRMFNNLRIPTVAIIENMSYFLCLDCNKKHNVFWMEGKLKELVESFGVSLHVELPLHPSLSRLAFKKSECTFDKSNKHSIDDIEGNRRNANEGNNVVSHDEKNDDSELIYPFALAFDESNPIWLILMKMTEDIVREISAVRFGARLPKISIGEDLSIVMEVEKRKDRAPDETAEEETELIEEESLSVACNIVRMACKCAECIDEITGLSKIDKTDVDDNLRVTEIQRTGNYAVTFYWSDGHFSIMPYKMLESLCRNFGTVLKPENLKCQATVGYEW